MNYYSKDMVSLNYKKLNISWQNILFSIFVSKTTFSEITNFCWKFLLVTLLILLWLHERLSKQLSQLLYKKSVFKIFAKFARRHLCQSLFFNKVAGLKSSTLLKKMLWHRCFPVNFVKFLRTSFLWNTSRSLLLDSI